jgi:hypothetical protein
VAIGFVARSQGDPKHAAELGDHPRPAHRPATGIRDLTHIDSTGHVGVAVTEQECDLVNA